MHYCKRLHRLSKPDHPPAGLRKSNLDTVVVATGTAGALAVVPALSLLVSSLSDICGMVGAKKMKQVNLSLGLLLTL